MVGAVTTRPCGGVFLVHGHGVNAQPVIGHHRVQPVAAPFRIQLLVNGAGAAAHLQATRHDAVHFQTALNAAVHGFPDLVEALVQFLAGDHRLLIGALHLGDGAAGTGRHLKHFPRRPEGIRHARTIIDGLAALLDRLQFRIGHDETAADGIIDALDEQPALIVEGGEDHAVGMAGQRVLLVEDQIFCGPKLIGRMAGRRYRSGLLHRIDNGVHRIGVDKVRPLAGEAQNDGTPCAVANAGKGERAMQADLQLRNGCTRRSRPLIAEDQRQEAVCSRHRPHRVGARRTDTDLEDVKDRKKHEVRPE